MFVGFLTPSVCLDKHIYIRLSTASAYILIWYDMKLSKNIMKNTGACYWSYNNDRRGAPLTAIKLASSEIKNYTCYVYISIFWF